MANFSDIERLAIELDDNKIINLDTPLRELLRPQGIGVIDPTNPLSDNVIAWSDYVLITSGKTSPLQDLVRVSEAAARVRDGG